MDLFPALPACAPLAEDQVRDLLIVYERRLPHGKEGRPRRGAPDKIARQEQRQQQALEKLLADIVSARQRVFELLDPLVRSKQLTRRALLDILYPIPLTPYPERLNDWARENLLWFDSQGNPEPGPTAAVLVQREMDTRKRRLPPPRTEPHSFSCWRWDTPQHPPFSYELPLVPLEGEEGSVLKPYAAPAPLPYILTTSWKGAAWDSDAWIIVEGGAIRWVGLPSEDQLAAWLSQQEVLSLAPSTDRADRAKRALRILVDRLPHSFSSDAPM